MAPTPTEPRALFLDRPIQQKLTIVVVATVAVAMLISLVGIVAMDSLLFRGYLRRDLSALASITADNSTAAVSFNDASAASETLAALRARSHVVAACTYRLDESTLAAYFRPGSPQVCPEIGKSGVRFLGSEVAVSQPILLQRRPIGTLVLRYDLGELTERARIYGSAALGVMLVASLLAFLLSSRLREVIAGPLAQLARAATTVSKTKDYTVRAQKHSADELGTLVDAFNDMLGSIQSRDQEIREALADRERAFRETASAEAFLRTTLASIGDAVVRADSEGRIVFANLLAQGLVKSSDENIIGRHASQVLRLIDEYTREPIEDPISRVLRDQTAAREGGCPVLIAGDGAEVSIDEHTTPIRGEDGTIEGAVLVFRDVAQRRRAEETRRLLASIVESSDDAIISSDLTGIVMTWNSGAERMFGYAADEMIGKPLVTIAAPGRDAEIHAILHRIGRGERIHHYQTMRRTKSGLLLHVSLTISPLCDADGQVIGASKIARDITSQVHAAEHLERVNAELRDSNSQLARSNEDLERFAFVASHDLQEPLRMITTYAQLLSRSQGYLLDEKLQQAVGNIIDSARRMRQLLADLLAYTEINTGCDAPSGTVDLNQVLDTVRFNLQAAIDESGAAITARPLPVLRGHTAQFIPLFQNLIGNAIKYRSDQPPCVQISVQERGGEFVFALADNGIGIAPEYHEKIFVAFKRLHGKQIPGTGIGLAICQRVVERHGGRIWVESQPGRGATFFFTIPKHLADIDGE